MVVVIVDTEARVRAFLPELRGLDCLVTVEPCEAVRYDDGPGDGDERVGGGGRDGGGGGEADDEGRPDESGQSGTESKK